MVFLMCPMVQRLLWKFFSSDRQLFKVRPSQPAEVAKEVTVYIFLRQPVLAGFKRPLQTDSWKKWSCWGEHEGSVGHEEAQPWSQGGPGTVFTLRVGWVGHGGARGWINIHVSTSGTFMWCNVMLMSGVGWYVSGGGVRSNMVTNTNQTHTHLPYSFHPVPHHHEPSIVWIWGKKKGSGSFHTNALRLSARSTKRSPGFWAQKSV